MILELFNEPFPDSNRDTVEAWSCWQQGGTCAGIDYAVAGMQQLVSAVREAGAMNLILLGGVQYSNSLSQWEASVPYDPQAKPRRGLASVQLQRLQQRGVFLERFGAGPRRPPDLGHRDRRKLTAATDSSTLP